jgi:uncharacterized protein YdhG (YjbR/CyaY superfamily)
MSETDKYFSNLAGREYYDHLRDLVLEMAPESKETMAYGIPTFNFKGKNIMHFGAFKDHMSLFPGGVVDNYKEELKDFKVSKGTIQFTADKPVPDELIKRMLKDNLERYGLSS